MSYQVVVLDRILEVVDIVNVDDSQLTADVDRIPTDSDTSEPQILLLRPDDPELAQVPLVHAVVGYCEYGAAPAEADIGYGLVGKQVPHEDVIFVQEAHLVVGEYCRVLGMLRHSEILVGFVLLQERGCNEGGLPLLGINNHQVLPQCAQHQGVVFIVTVGQGQILDVDILLLFQFELGVGLLRLEMPDLELVVQATAEHYIVVPVQARDHRLVLLGCLAVEFYAFQCWSLIAEVDLLVHVIRDVLLLDILVIVGPVITLVLGLVEFPQFGLVLGGAST